MNETWFLNRLREIDRSQAELAKFIGVHASTVNLTLKGMRRFVTNEASKWAEFLNVPVETVFLHAGVKIRAGEGSTRVPIIGVVGGDMSGQLFDKPREMIDAPASIGAGASAIVIETFASAAALFDGWVLFVGPEQPVGPGLSCVLHDGGLTLGVVRRGYARDTLNVLTMMGENISVKAGRARPVLWIKT